MDEENLPAYISFTPNSTNQIILSDGGNNTNTISNSSIILSDGSNNTNISNSSIILTESGVGGGVASITAGDGLFVNSSAGYVAYGIDGISKHNAGLNQNAGDLMISSDSDINLYSSGDINLNLSGSLILTGNNNNIYSSTAGTAPSNPIYLKIFLNGIAYKIALLNDT
jgi:hypothetical protein